MTNFFMCSECGSVMLEMGDPEKLCQSEHMTLFSTNGHGGDEEVHRPRVTMEGGKAVVRVGRQPHPMTPQHSIQWIFVKTSFGGLYCNLSPGDAPEAQFSLQADEVEEVYAYCNLHGLWKAKEPVLPIDFDLNTVACSPEFSAGCLDPSDAAGTRQ